MKVEGLKYSAKMLYILNSYEALATWEEAKWRQRKKGKELSCPFFLLQVTSVWLLVKQHLHLPGFFFDFYFTFSQNKEGK